MTQAQQVGLMSDPHKYIITNLDMNTLDLTPYQYGGSNITGVSLIHKKLNIKPLCVHYCIQYFLLLFSLRKQTSL